MGSTLVFDEEKQIWDNPRRRPNHFWDCEVMALALAYIQNVRALSPEGPEPKKRRPERVRGAQSIESRLGRLRR